MLEWPLSSPPSSYRPSCTANIFFFFSISATKPAPAATPPPQMQVPQINPVSFYSPRTWRKIQSMAKYRDILLYLPNSLLKCSTALFLMQFNSCLLPSFTFPVLFFWLKCTFIHFYTFYTTTLWINVQVWSAGSPVWHTTGSQFTAGSRHY